MQVSKVNTISTAKNNTKNNGLSPSFGARFGKKSVLEAAIRGRSQILGDIKTPLAARMSEIKAILTKDGKQAKIDFHLENPSDMIKGMKMSDIRKKIPNRKLTISEITELRKGKINTGYVEIKASNPKNLEELPGGACFYTEVESPEKFVDNLINGIKKAVSNIGTKNSSTYTR